MGSSVIIVDKITRDYLMGMAAYPWTRPFFVNAYGFDSVLDIGAHMGTGSLCAKLTNPDAHIVALEPGNDAFKALQQNVAGLNIDTHQIALGDGSTGRMQVARASVRNHFLAGEGDGSCRSMRLSDMVKEFSIDGRYCIKMNCEGGEAHVFDHDPSIEVLAGSEMILIACHGAELGARFESLCNTRFIDTHEWVQINNKRDHFNYVMVSKRVGYLAKLLVINKERRG